MLRKVILVALPLSPLKTSGLNTLFFWYYFVIYPVIKMNNDTLVRRILDAPAEIQTQVVSLLFSSRSAPRALALVRSGNVAQLRAALDRKDPPVIQQVKDLLDSPPPPQPAA